MCIFLQAEPRSANCGTTKAAGKAKAKGQSCQSYFLYHQLSITESPVKAGSAVPAGTDGQTKIETNDTLLYVLTVYINTCKCILQKAVILIL